MRCVVSHGCAKATHAVHWVQAEAALPEETKARRAWSMLRLNASVRKSSRIMASMLSTQRGAAINRVVRRSDEDLEDKPLLAPDEVEVLDDEAQEALEHLCPEDVANPHRSDGYRISALPTRVGARVMNAVLHFESCCTCSVHARRALCTSSATVLWATPVSARSRGLIMFRFLQTWRGG